MPQPELLFEKAKGQGLMNILLFLYVHYGVVDRVNKRDLQDADKPIWL